MFSFYALSAIFPALDTPVFEAAWDRYWRGRALRRLTAAALVMALAGSAIPARAVLPVTDETSIWQNGLHYAKQAVQWAEDNMKKVEAEIRDCALAYRAYKQSISVYNRVANLNVTASLVNCLPALEVDTPWGANRTEVVTIRPVFRPQERLASSFHPTFGLQSFNWKDLDFDVDRNVVSSPNPNANLNPQQLQEQAINDGWNSWILAQIRSGLSPDNASGPTTAPYRNLDDAINQQYQAEQSAEEQLVQQILEAYGESSPQYQEALRTYTNLIKAVIQGQPDDDRKALQTALQQIDSDAQVQLERFASASLSMALSAQRADSLRANNSQVHLKYDSDPGALATSFASSLGITQLLETIKALDADPQGQNKSTPGVPPKEALGNAMKQSNLQADIATSQQEALKHQTKATMENAQQQMIDLAQNKADLLAAYNKTHSVRLSAAQQRLALVLAERQRRANEVFLASMHLPDGMSPVVPDSIAPLVPNSIPASQAQDGGLSKNLTAASNNAQTQLSAGMATALAGIKNGTGMGFIAPLGRGIANAWQALTGHSFNLQSLGISESSTGSAS